MTTQPETQKPSKRDWLGGAILIVIGVLALMGQFIRAEWFGLLVLPTLAALFLLAGLFTRAPGLIVPGGILGGLGLGTWLVASGPYAEAAETTSGGVFLLAFASGWVLITVLTALLRRAMWWPLIPGAILALIGGALLVGGTALTVLEWAGMLWPLALIAGGVALLLKRRSA